MPDKQPAPPNAPDFPRLPKENTTAIEQISSPLQTCNIDYKDVASWGLALAILCAFPLLLIALGIDVSTSSAALSNTALDSNSAQSPNALALQPLREILSHTILEWTAVCAALFLSMLCFTRYQISGDTSFAIIGTALFCAGMMDIFHSLAADRFIQSASAQSNFVHYSWALSRLTQGVFILIAVGIYALLPTSSKLLSAPRATWILVPSFAVTTYLIISNASSTENLPVALYSNAFTLRPFDLYSLVPFLICGFILFPLYAKKYPSYFAYSLWLSAIPQIAVGLYMAYGSSQLHGNAFNIAHTLKIVAYLVPIAGLTIERIFEHGQQIVLKENLLIKTKTLLEKQREFESAQYQMAATADFAESLNKIDAQDTYQTAIETLSRNLQLPFAALYLESPQQGFHCQFVTNLDSEHIAADEIESSGFPLKVFREAKSLTLAGPFDDEQLVIRFGIGKIKLCAITGWPIMFQGGAIGVLVVGHISQTTEQQLIYINASLDQLGVRIYSFSLDEQRKELFSNLQKKSLESEKATLEATRANQVKSEFLANMSHELRTPMNSIIGFNKRLIKNLKGEILPRNYDALTTVDRNAQILLGLIDDILDLAKIEAGKMELSLSEVNLDNLIKQVISNTNSLLDKKDIEIKFNITDSQFRIQADSMKVQQILNNLISNAAKYTEEGHINISVSEGKHPKIGPCAKISIADTGIGISEENQKKLFQKFTQFDNAPSNKLQGTGLGLNITAEFIRMHKGTVEITSQPGIGSEFVVFLPIGDVQTLTGESTTTDSSTDSTNTTDTSTSNTNTSNTNTNHKETKKPPLTPAQMPLKRHHKQGLTVLCIDDGDNTAEFLRDIIQNTDVQVAVVKNQQNLLDLPARKLPDLICIDLESCNIKSLLRVERIKSEANIARIPMIVIAKKDNFSRYIKKAAVQLIPQHLIAVQLTKAISMRATETLKNILIVTKGSTTPPSLIDLKTSFDVKCHYTNNQATAIETLEKTPQDIIVMDFTSPSRDQYTLLEKLFAHEDWSMIPMLLLTPQTLSDSQMEFLYRYAKGIVTSGKYSAQLFTRSFLQHKKTHPSDRQSNDGLNDKASNSNASNDASNDASNSVA